LGSLKNQNIRNLLGHFRWLVLNTYMLHFHSRLHVRGRGGGRRRDHGHRGCGRDDRGYGRDDRESVNELHMVQFDFGIPRGRVGFPK